MPPRSENLAPSIDAYLAKRGSPMAGQGMAFLRAGRKYGVDPRLLVGIATIESGAGAHEKLPHNPFNWGVHRGQTYGSYEESIMDVARGLRRGYIDKGLKTPGQIVSRYAPSSDGNDESNWAKVVGQVMGQLGGKVSAGVPTSPARSLPAPGPLPPLPQAPQRIYDPALASQQIRNQFIAGKGRIDLLGLPQTVASSYREVLPPPPNPAPGPEDALPSGGTHAGHHHGEKPGVATRSGKGILAPRAFKKTHDTSGLGWPAVDIMGHPGTPLRTPVAGVVVRHGSAQGGEALYIDTDGDGEGDYWAGHITNMVPVGTELRVGDRFADISPDHAAPHLHWARR